MLSMGSMKDTPSMWQLSHCYWSTDMLLSLRRWSHHYCHCLCHFQPCHQCSHCYTFKRVQWSMKDRATTDDVAQFHDAPASLPLSHFPLASPSPLHIPPSVKTCWLGGGYCRWVEGAVNRPSSLPCPPLLFPILPFTCHLIDSPSVVNSNRFVIVDSCCLGGIALLWWNCVVMVVGNLWQLGGYKCQWGGMERGKATMLFTPSPCRFLPPFINSPIVSSIYLLPCHGVLLHHCGVLICHWEVLPCRRQVLPHHHGVLCLIIMGDLLGHVEARDGHHSM